MDEGPQHLVADGLPALHHADDEGHGHDRQ
jgi:hypothetical protein